MPFLVADKAQLLCSMGSTPSVLTVPPTPDHSASAAPPPVMLLATVNDFKPGANIAPFGLCRSPANPAVQAATAAASGVPTPAPCVPATTLPWAPPSPTVLIRGVPAVGQVAKCQCSWQGTITVVNPGQARVQAI